MSLKLLSLRKHFVNFIQVRNYPTTGRPPRCDAHMNELPVPCLPWYPWYKDQQSYYNKVLFIGAAWPRQTMFLSSLTPKDNFKVFLDHNVEFEKSGDQDLMLDPETGIRNYLMVVLFAILISFWWLFSLGMMIWTNSLYLNWGPPAQPGPPSDIVEECDDSD